MTSQKVRELVNWGDAALEQSDLDDAESAYARAIEAGRTSGGGIALALDGLMRLASRYVMLGFLGRPHALHRYFIETDTLDVARDLKDLANLRDTQGDVKGCEMILTRILELKLDVLGPAHEETLAALQDAALVLQTQGKSPEHLYKLAFSRKAEEWVETEPAPAESSSVESPEPLLSPVESTEPLSSVESPEPQLSPVESTEPLSWVESSEPLLPPGEISPEPWPEESPERAESTPPIVPALPGSAGVPPASADMENPSSSPPSSPSLSPSFLPPSPSPASFASASPVSNSSVPFTSPSPWPEPTTSAAWSSDPARPSNLNERYVQSSADAIAPKNSAPQAESPFGSSSNSLFAPPLEVPPQKVSGDVNKSYLSKVEALLSAEAFRAYLPPEELESQPEAAQHDAWAVPGGVTPAYSNPAWTGGASGVAAAPEEDLWARETSGGIHGYSEQNWTSGVSVGNASAPYSAEKAWGSEETEAGSDQWILASSLEAPVYSSHSAWGSEAEEDIWTRETGAGLPAYSEPQSSATAEEDIWTKETGVGLSAYSEPQGSSTRGELASSQHQVSPDPEEANWTKETFAGIPAYSESSSLTLTGDSATDESVGMQHRIPVIAPDNAWLQETSGDLPVYSESARLTESTQPGGVEISAAPSSTPAVTPEILEPQSQSFLAAAASQFISASTHMTAPAVTNVVDPPQDVQPAMQSAVQPSGQPAEVPPSEVGPDALARPANESLWNDCLDYLKKRIDHCACDQHLKRFIALTNMIHDALERARPQANSDETATVALATISRIDWKILNDLGEMYEKLSGTNAAAYELSLIYALSIRVEALGAKHTDTTLTLDRLCRLYKLLGIGDLAQSVRRVLHAMLGLVETTSAADETLPISRRVQPSGPKQEEVLNDPVGTIRAHFLILSKNPPKEDSIRIIQEVRAAFNRLSAPEVAPFLSRLLELTGNILGEDHPETAGCLFDAARFAKELQRPGFERAFQKAFQIYVKAGATGPAVASCAFEFASVCKAIDDSEAGRLRTRAVAICSMTYGLLHHKTRQIVSPLDTRLISLEFDFATTAQEDSPTMESPAPTKFSGSASDMVAALLRDTRILEISRAKHEENAVRHSVDEVCSIYADLESGTTLGADIAPVEHIVLALMLEYQALRELDQRNFSTADRILETAAKIRQAVLPAGHADHALSMFRRGFILARRNDLNGADQFYKRSIDVLEPIRGEQLLLHAAVLNNLGAIEFRRADYAQAGRYFERAYNQMEAMTDVAPLLDICRANIAQVKEILVFLAKLE